MRVTLNNRVTVETLIPLVFAICSDVIPPPRSWST